MHIQVIKLWQMQWISNHNQDFFHGKMFITFYHATLQNTSQIQIVNQASYSSPTLEDCITHIEPIQQAGDVWERCRLVSCGWASMLGHLLKETGGLRRSTIPKIKLQAIIHPNELTPLKKSIKTMYSILLKEELHQYLRGLVIATP